MLQYSLQELLVFLPPLPLSFEFLLFLEFLRSARLSQALPLGALVRFDVHCGFQGRVSTDLA